MNWWIKLEKWSERNDHIGLLILMLLGIAASGGIVIFIASIMGSPMMMDKYQFYMEGEHAIISIGTDEHEIPMNEKAFITVTWETRGQYLTSKIRRDRLRFDFDQDVKKPKIQFEWSAKKLFSIYNAQLNFKDIQKEFGGVSNGITTATIICRRDQWFE